MIVAHAGDVIQAVGERDIVQIGIALADLLVIAVQIAHHRLKRGYGFAIDRQHHAEDAVRAGMMRAHIDDQLVRLEAVFVHDALDIDAQTQ